MGTTQSSAEFHHILSRSMLDFVHHKHNFKIYTGFVNLKLSTADGYLKVIAMTSCNTSPLSPIVRHIIISNTQKSECVSWTKFSIYRVKKSAIALLVLQDDWEEVKVWKPWKSDTKPMALTLSCQYSYHWALPRQGLVDCLRWCKWYAQHNPIGKNKF